MAKADCPPPPPKRHHRQPKLRVSNRCCTLTLYGNKYRVLNNRCNLLQMAQMQFPYLSQCCSLVSFLYILGPLEAIWRCLLLSFVAKAINGPRMYKNDTREQQLRLGTLYVPFAPIYNDFANSISVVPIQVL